MRLNGHTLPGIAFQYTFNLKTTGSAHFSRSRSARANIGDECMQSSLVVPILSQYAYFGLSLHRSRIAFYAAR